jgi:transcriptional regulator of acetoin/glycerol metabolism
VTTMPRITPYQVRDCIKNIHNGTAMHDSPLLRLPNVTKLAAQKYRGSYWSQSHALRDIILDICRQLSMDDHLGRRAHRAATFLKVYVLDGQSLAQAARTLGIPRSTVYKYVMPEAWALIADELRRYC